MRHKLGGPLLAVGIGTAVLGGCASENSVSPVADASSTPGDGTFASATLHLVIPEATTPDGRRRPAYISPNTTSLMWTLDGAREPLISLVPGVTTGCTASTTTTKSTICTVTFDVAPGTHTFVFTLVDAAGAPLSSGTALAVAIVPGASKAIDVTLGGITSYVTITSTSPSFVPPVPGRGSVYTLYGTRPVTLSIDAVDASGATIVGAGSPALSATLVPPGTSASPVPATLAAATPSSQTNATSGNTFVLTPSFAPALPTVGSAGTIKVAIVPATGGGTPTTEAFSLLLYVPRIDVAQADGSGTVTSYDEQGAFPTPLATKLGAPAAIAYGANTSTASPAPVSLLYVGTVTPVAGKTPVPANLLTGAELPFNIDGSAPKGVGTFANAGVPVGLAFDTNLNRLDVLESTGPSLVAYDAAGMSSSTLVSTIPNATAIAYDSKNLDVYVATGTSVLAYTEQGALDTRVMAFASLSAPSAVAYDATDDVVLVADRAANTVGAYAPMGGMPSRAFAVTSAPTALLFDPYDSFIYVSNGAAIVAYDGRVNATTFGSVQTLTGTFSGLNSVTSLTVVQ